MKLNPLFAAAIVLTATPAFAAPQWVEDACWRYAYRVRPALSWREMEAFDGRSRSLRALSYAAASDNRHGLTECN
jgi:hypothetical protein